MMARGMVRSGRSNLVGRKRGQLEAGVGPEDQDQGSPEGGQVPGDERSEVAGDSTGVGQDEPSTPDDDDYQRRQLHDGEHIVRPPSRFDPDRISGDDEHDEGGLEKDGPGGIDAGDEGNEVLGERHGEDGHREPFSQEESPAHHEPGEWRRCLLGVGVGPADAGQQDHAVREGQSDHHGHHAREYPNNERGGADKPGRDARGHVDIRSNDRPDHEIGDVEGVELALQPDIYWLQAVTSWVDSHDRHFYLCST